MNTYRNISNELGYFFNNHPIMRTLLPLDTAFLFGGLGILLLNQFAFVGSLLTSLAYYSFLLGLLLTYAKFNQKFLYYGFFGYAGIQAYHIILNIFKYNFLSYDSLITGLVFGGIGYLVFKKSTQPNI
ncbi:MAG: hypothetical protein N2645_14015 [Clostridia bacterium]|nr:hypothetical protein [Clostridia bacterium]